MIDIHTHILPDVDDGAEDMQDALLMAELSVESGVTTVIATPHSNLPEEFGEYPDADIQMQLRKMRNCLLEREVPLQILSGMEIYATEDVLEKIRGGSLISLNDSGRYLVEFGFHKRSFWITEILNELCEHGYFPIVAHPERYACVQKHPEVVLDWLDMGCQLQINKGSFFGNFGRGSFLAANKLLQNETVTYVASDAHSPYQRTTYMRDIYDFFRLEYSSSLAKKLLTENPQRYLIEKTE